MRTQPIRIGGKDRDGRQKTASPLELAGDPAAPEPETSLWCDWEGIAVAAKLNRLERAVFLRMKRDGKDGRSTASMLGITFHTLGPINRNISRKLQRHKEALKPYFVPVNTTEKALETFWARQRYEARLGTFIEGAKMKTEELKEKLASQREKWERIATRENEARVALKESETALAALEQSVKKDAVQSVLDEREYPDPAVEKKLLEARANVARAQAQLAAVEKAVTKQSDVVDRAAAEVASHRREAADAELQPAFEEFRALRIELAEKVGQILRVAEKHGITYSELADLFSPVPAPTSDDFMASAFRQAAAVAELFQSLKR